MKVQIGIIGAGPAGLLLSQLLNKQGISNIVIEKSSRPHVEERLRAGVLEPGTVALLNDIDAGQRLQQEGLVHEGFGIVYNDSCRRINLKALAQDCVTVYGQTEITKDVISAKMHNNDNIVFEAQNVDLDDFDSAHPAITYIKDEQSHRIDCDFIAGCDGFMGVSRQTLKSAVGGQGHEYPFAWLGILVKARPLSDEIVYANSPKGFALYSMRSPQLSRNYIQCAPGTNIVDWSDDHIWDELQARVGNADMVPLEHGLVIEKSVIPMRSYIVDDMRFGSLFLAGDAAHILPPTGAKGLNLAASDAQTLAQAFTAYYKDNKTGLLNNYSYTCLDRANKALDFSLHMTYLLHNNKGNNRQHQTDSLDKIFASTQQSTLMAKKYLGRNYG